MIPAKNLKIGNYVLHSSEPYIVRELKLTDSASIVLEGLFSEKNIELAVPLDEPFEEFEIARRCASIVSKSKDKVQLMDITSFEIFDAKIEPELLGLIEENDQVTYIKHKDAARVVELRKDSKDSILPDMHILQEDL